MKEIINNDIYQFHCTCCGDCCSGNMDININLYDLHKMATFLKLNHSHELFSKKYIHLVHSQNEVWMPQILFKTYPLKFCPWIINDLNTDKVLKGYCKLHPFHKPLVCKMAPLSRTVNFDEDKISYFITDPTDNCEGMKLNKDNSVSQLKRDYKEELQFEVRYYRILENLQGKNMTKEYMENEIYSFPINDNFESILNSLENKSKILL